MAGEGRGRKAGEGSKLSEHERGYEDKENLHDWGREVEGRRE